MTDIIRIADDFDDVLVVEDEGDTINIAPDSAEQSYQLNVDRVREMRDFFDAFLAKNGDKVLSAVPTIIVNQFILASPEAQEYVLGRVEAQETPAPRSVADYAQEALETDQMLSFYYTSRGDSESSFRMVQVIKVKDDRFEGFYNGSGDPEDYRQFLFSRVDETRGLYIHL